MLGIFLVFAIFLCFSQSSHGQASPTPFSTPTPGFPSYWINDYPVGDDPNLWADYDLDQKYISVVPGCKGDGCEYKQGLRIDQTVPSIKVAITGLKPEETYYLCGQRDKSRCEYTSGDAVNAQFKADKNGTITLKICGGGVDWVKGSGTDGTSGTLEESCDDKDYFHEGETYDLNVYKDKNGKNRVITATFFVQHSYPIVKISPENSTKFSAITPIAVSLWGRRPGGNNDNNYQMLIEGLDNGYKHELCLTTKDGSGETVGIHTQGIDLDKNVVVPDHLLQGIGWDTLARDANQASTKTFGQTRGGIGTGNFVLKINERLADNRPLGIGEYCEGGHSYLYIYFRIDKKAPNGITIYKVAYDPNNSDWEDKEDILSGGKVPFPPCAKGAFDEASGTCSELNTAIGNIPTTLEGFIAKVFQYVLALAGMGGIIIIIYAGYVFMTSRGDKEKIAGARETLTAAIVGLLFIILSIVILEIIGVDILQIPGLKR